jgi:hypothetical protein
MSVGKKLRQLVRQRAGFACEYCGVAESDSGAELTIDHFRPENKGGTGTDDNLVYCCYRCNEYKSDYFSDSEEKPSVWNPRTSLYEEHFLEMEDGVLNGLTITGEFTIRLLRLNRPLLVAYRRIRKRKKEHARLFSQMLEISAALRQTVRQANTLSEEQKSLLDEQMRLLKMLTGDG